jgi:FecR protein
MVALAKRLIAALLLSAAAALLLASSAMAGERVGVVTNIEGTATVARLTQPDAQLLQFKDAVFLRDRITTGERSFVRVLLGGKATVTARERSVLTITEVPGVATVQLGEGRISVAVSKALMKPGEVIEIKTPNAVTAIRGTVVVAEVEPAGNGYRSTITILRGLVDVTRLHATAGLVGPAVKVGALQRVSVVGAGSVPPPTSITQEDAGNLASEFSMVPKEVPAASVEALNASLKEAAIRDILRATGGTSDVVTTVTGTVSDLTGTVGQVVPGGAGIAAGAVGGLAGTATGTTSATLVNPVLNTVTDTTSAVTNGLLSGVKKVKK